MENSNNMGINQYSSSEVPSEIKKMELGSFYDEYYVGHR